MTLPLVLLNRRRIGGFSPRAIIAGSTALLWLDPSDLTTLFQDAAGTTPVTGPGQPVGLALDKSQGLVLGSELILNGDLSDGVNNWAQVLGTRSVVNGRLRVARSGGAQGRAVSAAMTCVIGRTYRVTMDVFIGTVSTVDWYVGISATSTAGNIYNASRASNGTVSFVFVATQTTHWLGLQCSVGVDGDYTEFDNISVRELPGFHATQATAASRPTYGIVPATGRRNLLVNTTTMATQSLTVSAVAHTLSFTGTGTVTLSGASTAGPLVGTGANDRVSLTFTPTAASLTLTVTGSVTLAQLEIGSTATAYQRVGSAFDVTEAGVPSLSYLSFDGVDDFLVTPTITPNADKAQVFAGVRKLSDVVGAVAERSTAYVANNGSFILYNRTTAGWGYNVRGSTNVDISVGTGYAAPVSNVLSGTSDISGDRSALRINGTQVAQSTADQGTGNYLAYPLYIGRRAGTSFNFNGQIYSLIVRFGANLDANTITNTERWVGGKTGVTI